MMKAERESGYIYVCVRAEGGPHLMPAVLVCIYVLESVRSDLGAVRLGGQR